MEKEITSTFQEYDQTERELFTAFTNAIRDSHEKQRAQLEYTKYFGLILSITGSFLAFCYSTLKKQDLKKFIEERLTSLDDKIGNQKLYELIHTNEETLKEVSKNRKAIEEILVTIKGSLPTYMTMSSHEKPEGENFTQSDVLKTAGFVLVSYLLIKLIFQ